MGKHVYGRWVLALLIIGYWLLMTRASTAVAQTTHTVTAADGPLSLATAVTQAQAGDVIEVHAGVYHGPITVDRPLTLVGIGWPVVDGRDTGNVILITAANVTVTGFEIRNSGSSLDEENAGLAVAAESATLAHNRLVDTLFGIYLKNAHGSVIRDNTIHGKDVAIALRGDPIRVWYSNDVTVTDNAISQGRDVVLWYSERLTIRGNQVSNGRYGLHFMYCDDALIAQNRLLDNSVGAFLMYSRRMTLHNNTIAGNRGPSGYGLGMKDMDDAIVRDNLFLDNRIGIHLDNSPREVDSIGHIEGNVFGYNDIGVNLLPSVRHNQFTQNSFVENQQQVSITGGGVMPDNTWATADAGNYWSDYAGYDAAGDGRGDLAYRSEKLFENLMDARPELRLFLFSPAANAVDFAAKAFPLVRPQAKLVDDNPLMVPSVPANVPALPQPSRVGGLWSGLMLLALALGITLLPRLRLQFYHISDKRF